MKQFKNKRVIITGHTGFKGSWLAIWMHLLGAKVIGISNKVPTNPSHYKYLQMKSKIKNIKLDIRDSKKLKRIFKKFKPNYVFHLAAQSLVKQSYIDPKYTLETNSIGTLNILESLKAVKNKCIAVLITSDKVYKNLELGRGYVENDVLGGKDPYSVSKASAELIIQSYIDNFFPIKKTKVLIAIARAGNVVGGGDWSKNRLIPDCVKSWSKKKKVLIRNPKSTRPWQHVLEAISGYILLAKHLNENKKLHGEAFNFGPDSKTNYNVTHVIKLMKKYWGDISWKFEKNKSDFKETNILNLNSIKSKKKLNWQCILSLDETFRMVAEWYKNFYSKKNISKNLTFEQIKNYQNLLKQRINLK